MNKNFKTICLIDIGSNLTIHNYSVLAFGSHVKKGYGVPPFTILMFNLKRLPIIFHLAFSISNSASSPVLPGSADG